MNDSDIKFFTNEAGSALYDRFLKTLEYARFFDVLVGYFRTSGFDAIYRALDGIEKIRILVGLDVDSKAVDIYNSANPQSTFDFESHKKTRNQFSDSLQTEMVSSEDNREVHQSVKKFIEFIQEGKLEIRAYPSRDIHAKVYIIRYGKPVSNVTFGSVITGSSNFSQSGLVAQREFNVELKDRQDVKFALEKFEKLWAESVDLSQEYIDTIQKKTWLNDQITPYELYLKLIYEYLEEDINLEDEFEEFLPKGFLRLQYQKQAAIQARKILERYNGVFLADVVGLGKTFVTSLLLQQMPTARKLIICPPVLQSYWNDTLFDFGIQRYEVQSLGKLEHIIRKSPDRFDIVIIDEAHRFRNETTQSYASLFEICRRKKIILVSATPLNNTIDDIFSQVKLFQAPRRSAIPGVPNLEQFFSKLRGKLVGLDKRSPEYALALNEVSNEIRDRILKYIMVRRTRNDVTNYFSDDIHKQGLSFPEVSPPKKITYHFSGSIETTFNKTIKLLRDFKYARYVPLTYVESEQLTAFQLQQQKNIGGFMKSLLVKRLESSFYAFRQSIGRFIESYEKFIKMFNEGMVYISKKVDVYELLEKDSVEELEDYVEQEKAQKYKSDKFSESFSEHLKSDLNILKRIRNLWATVNEDPKLDEFISKLKFHDTLAGKKLIIFTESRETGDYLYENLIKEFPLEVVFYSGQGGRHTNENAKYTHQIARDMIKANFDPNNPEQQNDFRILITTDMLAEGINLHRGNIIINYDLPWNPTRVMQRTGRVNRLGTEHQHIHIFNFFPTTQSDVHLGLEANIVSKIQLFHNILGEDAKYLSDGEEIGSQQLFDTLNNKKTYTGEEEEGDTELKYLDVIRQIRDNDSSLFKKIKSLPRKARSGFKTETISKNRLVTFFRQGHLKKFYTNEGTKVEEITFFDAVDKLECKPETLRQEPPENYFDMLSANKHKFELDTTIGDEPSGRRGGRSNLRYILNRLNDKQFLSYGGFTESDEDYLNMIRRILEDGSVAKRTAKDIKGEIEIIEEPLKILMILRRHIPQPEKFLHLYTIPSANKREVILSGYLLKS
ncbi:MAG: DEAD/DEAH box helicase family protein [Sedimentisphaerales bacterium]|nr:DEAD/DEAH box helicase family protein [Sedimentisphaerales bacterium]